MIHTCIELRPAMTVEQAQQAGQDTQKDNFQAIFHESLDVIVIVDSQNGRIIEVNQTVYPTLGYQREMLIGQPFSVLFPPTSEPAVQGEKEKQQFQIHDTAVEKQDFLHAEGTTRPMDLTIKLIPWHNDQAILITLRDATERRQAEAAQEKLIQELDAFAHTVAHDLKAPLTVMLGAATTITDAPYPVTGKILDNLLQLIVQSGNKMGSIIQELLLLAEVRGKKIEANPLDMVEVVAEALKRFRPTIKASHAQIDLPSRWPVALGYGPWVEEIWANYLSNALKYGGQPPRIELGASVQPDNSVRFWVRDNGPGITPEEQARLFIPFNQLSQVKTKGQGLGLSIVSRIAERLDGTVGVESEIGRGSVFSFTLPGPARG